MPSCLTYLAARISGTVISALGQRCSSPSGPYQLSVSKAFILPDLEGKFPVVCAFGLCLLFVIFHIAPSLDLFYRRPGVLESACWMFSTTLGISDRLGNAWDRPQLNRLTEHMLNLRLFNKCFKHKHVPKCFAIDGWAPKCAAVLCWIRIGISLWKNSL